jgi:hypothetical protein
VVALDHGSTGMTADAIGQFMSAFATASAAFAAMSVGV